jgi:hypothetical protein
MADGWREAGTVDLDDVPAVAKVVHDLAFLATDSAPARTSVAAQAMLRRALSRR